MALGENDRTMVLVVGSVRHFAETRVAQRVASVVVVRIKESPTVHVRRVPGFLIVRQRAALAVVRKAVVRPNVVGARNQMSISPTNAHLAAPMCSGATSGLHLVSVGPIVRKKVAQVAAGSVVVLVVAGQVVRRKVEALETAIVRVDRGLSGLTVTHQVVPANGDRGESGRAAIGPVSPIVPDGKVPKVVLPLQAHGARPRSDRLRGAAAIAEEASVVVARVVRAKVVLNPGETVVPVLAAPERTGQIVVRHLHVPMVSGHLEMADAARSGRTVDLESAAIQADDLVCRTGQVTAIKERAHPGGKMTAAVA